MIAFDAGKELHSSPFEPIGADQTEYRRALSLEVVVEKRFAEHPHRQPRQAYRVPNRCSVLNYTNRRRKFVRTTAQAPQLGAGSGWICRLVEPGAAAHEDLVGADHDSSVIASR